MSELENKNELDSYGVWVKTPPKTVDSSSTASKEPANDIFNIDTDLPDFSDLDVISENNGTEDYDNNDTSLSQEELNAIAGVTADTPLDEILDNGSSEEKPEEEHKVNENGEEEISLDEFLEGGVFQTGPDEDKIREHEGTSPEPAAEPETNTTETESVDLSDFGVDDSGSDAAAETPAEDQAPSFADADNDDLFNIDLSFDDSSAPAASENSGITAEEPSFEVHKENPDSPAGTEDVDLSEFGLSDFNEDDSSTDSTSSSADTSEDDGMESVDLSEFGFDDTSSDETSGAEKESPAEGSMAIEEQPVSETAAPETTEEPAEKNEDDFTVSVEETPAPQADTVSEAAPASDFAPAEDSDFDVDSLLGNVTDENGKTVSIGSQEENVVKEVTDIPSDEPVLDVPAEDIEDFNAPAENTIQAEEPSLGVPDTFDEEANSIIGNDFSSESDAEQASQIADSIKAPILEEMENSEESQPSTQMTAIFSQVVGELSSLKDEIASLKKELSDLKTNNTIAATSEDKADESAGFFSNTDEDDTIALSNDELDNILNTASFSTEEAPKSDAPADNSLDAGDDEIQPALELPEDAAPAEENSEVDIPDDDFSDSTDFDVDFNNENLEEPSLDKVDYSNVSPDAAENDLPEEISIPKSDDMIVESSSSDLMDSVPSDSMASSGIEEPASAEDIAAFADYSKEEPSISESLTDAKIDYLSADTDKAVAESESAAVPQNGSIPGDLKTEIKSVLSYMDQLLENLPEDKIAEFAQSEQFDTYKKLFKELGLA